MNYYYQSGCPTMVCSVIVCESFKYTVFVFTLICLSVIFSVKMVKRALNETKGGKAPGIDGVRVEMLKEGGVTVLGWLVRLFNICFMLSIVPVDWVIACMVP